MAAALGTIAASQDIHGSALALQTRQFLQSMSSLPTALEAEAPRECAPGTSLPKRHDPGDLGA